VREEDLVKKQFFSYNIFHEESLFELFPFDFLYFEKTMNPNVLDEVVNQAKNLGVAAVKLLNGSPVGDLRQIATKHMVEAGSKQSEKALEVLNRTPLGSGNVNVFIINNNGPMVIVPAADTQIPKPPLGSITSSWSELSEVSPIRRRSP
jgi:hypothetical protein